AGRLVQGAELLEVAGEGHGVVAGLGAELLQSGLGGGAGGREEEDESRQSDFVHESSVPKGPRNLVGPQSKPGIDLCQPCHLPAGSDDVPGSVWISPSGVLSYLSPKPSSGKSKPPALMFIGRRATIAR